MSRCGPDLRQKLALRVGRESEALGLGRVPAPRGGAQGGVLTWSGTRAPYFLPEERSHFRAGRGQGKSTIKASSH